jgi:hypothetical protein
MSAAHKCDWCGSLFTPYLGMVSLRVSVVTKIVGDVVHGDTKTENELCRQCSGEFAALAPKHIIPNNL